MVIYNVQHKNVIIYLTIPLICLKIPVYLTILYMFILLLFIESFFIRWIFMNILLL